jgi:hypothetical protein
MTERGNSGCQQGRSRNDRRGDSGKATHSDVRPLENIGTVEDWSRDAPELRAPQNPWLDIHKKTQTQTKPCQCECRESMEA